MKLDESSAQEPPTDDEAAAPDSAVEEDESPLRATDPGRTFRLRDAAAVTVAYLVLWNACRYAVSLSWAPDDYTFSFAFMTASLLAVGAAVLWTARSRGLRVRELFVQDRPWYVETLWGVAAAAGIHVAIDLGWRLRIPLYDPVAVDLTQQSLAVRWEFLAYSALLSPFGVELLFRGAVQSSLYPRIGVFACAVQAAILAVIHWQDWPVVPWVAFIGLCLGALALWRRCLLAGMVANGIVNLTVAAWLIFMHGQNAHVPAATMAEAETPPSWIDEPTYFAIPEEATAYDQVQSARFTFGECGWMLWKDEIKALRHAREKFPEEDQQAALALGRIQSAYLYDLHDPRRSIVAGTELLETYPQERYAYAYSLVDLAAAHAMIGERDRSEALYREAERDYSTVAGLTDHIATMRAWPKYWLDRESVAD